MGAFYKWANCLSTRGKSNKNDYLLIFFLFIPYSTNMVSVHIIFCGASILYVLVFYIWGYFE